MIAALAALPFATCGSACGSCEHRMDVGHTQPAAMCADTGEISSPPSVCVSRGCSSSYGSYSLDGCYLAGNNVSCSLVCNYTSGYDMPTTFTPAAPSQCPLSCSPCVDLGGGDFGCPVERCEGG